MMNELVIDVKGLKKSFAGKIAVNGVDFQIKKGEIYGFLGANGSGKTTSIRMLCGLLKCDEGVGHCLGFDVIRDSKKIKERTGYMTQHFSLYKDLTIRENLRFIATVYGLDNVKQRVVEALKEMQIPQRRHDQLAGTLSGGWKQRLALAAALIHNPKLLLLDEPTAGVDPQARRDFWSVIHELADRGVTILVSTHYMDEAERCTRLSYIARGCVMTTGTVNSIIKEANLIVWSAQTERMSELASALKKIPAVHQIIPFGRNLHVLGIGGDDLENSLSPFLKQKDIIWKKRESSLEDVFIYYTSLVEDQPSE